MSRHPDSKLNATALLSVLVGVFGTLCFFWGIAGLGAIVLGAIGHGEIKRSEGRQYGIGLAIAGMTVGVLHVVGLVVGTAVLFALAARPATAGGVFPSAPAIVPSPSPVPAPPKPPPAAPRAEQPGAASRESERRMTRFGGVTLIDPAADEGTLTAIIENELAQAEDAQQKLVLWVSAPDCAPCTGVSVALASPRLQASLASVRIVRVDARDYHVELARRGIPIDVLPGFALIGPRGEPLDYVNGGEWDADIPENIAPVLGNFVKGTYRSRRNPWRGPARPGETAL